MRFPSHAGPYADHGLRRPLAAPVGLLAAVGIVLAACSSPATTAVQSMSPPAVSTASNAAPSKVSSEGLVSSGSPLPGPPAESPLLETTGAPTPFPATPSQAVTTHAGSTAPAEFTANISTIDDAMAARMVSSWRRGCPVALTDLRYLSLTYRGFDGADHQGELVVADSVATDVVDIFRSLYSDGYPIASLRLVDDFGGSDDDSMSANNSSAFNCRPVTGGGGFSEHSYGTAIDLNPVQNPYLSGSTVLPTEGQEYADRHSAPGVIEPGDAVVVAFANHGWQWGGDWTGPIDYQHFSVSGR